MSTWAWVYPSKISSFWINSRVRINACLKINSGLWRRLYRRRPFLTALLGFVLAPSNSVWADTVYQTPADFVQQSLHVQADAPALAPKVIWLDKQLQQSISAILGHPYPQARLRYWCNADTCVWVLDEIGKEFPITAGFVVQGETIKRAQVLVYRETRGMEIHLPRYLAQFRDLRSSGTDLARKVDGIAGATLSCNAMTKMARLALLLNKTVTK